MSELAYSQSGEPFEVPVGATGWRVKRLKAKGAPEVVYSHEGPPLVLAIDDGIDELRAAVDGAPGRYRLDPIGDDGKQLTSGPSGYVYVHAAPAATTLRPDLAVLPTMTVLPPASDSVAIEMLRMHTEGMREAMRATAQIATSVVGGFPSMMGASATVLQAADGAGLPTRTPRVIDVEAIEVATDEDNEDEKDDDAPAPSSSALVELGNAVAAQMMPVLPFLLPQMMAKLGGMFGFAVPSAPPKASAPLKASAPATVAPNAGARSPALGAIAPSVIAKLGPIYVRLSPAEQMRISKLALELAPEEQAAFAARLAELTPEAALANLRALIGTEPTGVAS